MYICLQYSNVSTCFKDLYTYVPQTPGAEETWCTRSVEHSVGSLVRITSCLPTSSLCVMRRVCRAASVPADSSPSAQTPQSVSCLKSAPPLSVPGTRSSPPVAVPAHARAVTWEMILPASCCVYQVRILCMLDTTSCRYGV